MDYIHSKAEKGVLSVGKAISLPSSFTCSSRNVQQRYQDTMSGTRKYAKLQLFIKMTCNPKWKEISENLAKPQIVEHRPGFVTRTFDLKLFSDVCVKQFLGNIGAKPRVIDFQKEKFQLVTCLLHFSTSLRLETAKILII